MTSTPPQIVSPQGEPTVPFPTNPKKVTLEPKIPLTVRSLQAVTINRERLSEWHHKIRGKIFPMLPGFFVRCRIEDSDDGASMYKVGCIKHLRADWSVELEVLTNEEVTAGRNHTNYDCISNQPLSEGEFDTFVSSLPLTSIPKVVETIHHSTERLRLLKNLILVDPAFQVRKGRPDPRASPDAGGAGPHAGMPLPEKYMFSHNVLVVDDDTEGLFGPNKPVSLDLKKILAGMVGQPGVAEPDTPRMLVAQDGTIHEVAKPRFEDALVSDSTMVSLDAVSSYVKSPTIPLPDPAKILRMLHDAERPGEFEYSNIEEFARASSAVCRMATAIFKKEPLNLALYSPIAVIGDIHGNYGDLQFFLRKLIGFDDVMLRFTPAHLLFLGDYVDRGFHSFECIMYLLALKCIAPDKISLLRGNHESPEVNGDVEVYGYTSFKYQCVEVFGEETGLRLWAEVNEVFRYLPVMASIDRKIFCVHGGLPQYTGGEDRRLEILMDPNFPRIPVVQAPDADCQEERTIVNDLLWSDPALPGAPLDEFGFGPNPRGPDIKTFGSRAVDQFCRRYGFQYIFRAHQEKADGVRLSDSARVLTIFSTSDYAGHQNGAGCILVQSGKIRMMIKKPRRIFEQEQQPVEEQ